MNELEVLAAQVGYRVQDCLQIDGVWTVILDDEDGEITSIRSIASCAVAPVDVISPSSSSRMTVQTPSI